MQKGIFLCKLKKKEDETANASSSESCQPSVVADEEIPDVRCLMQSSLKSFLWTDKSIHNHSCFCMIQNPTMFNPDEILETLKELDWGHKLEMDEQQQPSCSGFTQLNDFTNCCGGLPHLSEEKNDDMSWIENLVDDDEKEECQPMVKEK